MIIRRENQPMLSSLINDLFNDYSSAKTPFELMYHRNPSANIKELEDRFIIEMVAPGFKKDDFEILIENRQLTVKSKIKESSEISNEKYIHKEYVVREFSRSFTMSDSVDLENIIAKYEEAILTLELQKNEKSKLNEPRKIHIS